MDGGEDVEACRPFTLRRDRETEPDAVGAELGFRGTRGNPRLAHEVLPPVAEHELAVLDAYLVLSLLRERVLDLEEVREVGSDFEEEVELEGLGRVVDDREILVEAVTDGALPKDRERCIVVHGPVRRREEELDREVVDVIRRQDPRQVAVNRQPPAREDARVLVEEPVRLIRRAGDVPAPVADDEGVAFENADRLAGHGLSFDDRVRERNRVRGRPSA